MCREFQKFYIFIKSLNSHVFINGKEECGDLFLLTLSVDRGAYTVINEKTRCDKICVKIY